MDRIEFFEHPLLLKNGLMRREYQENLYRRAVRGPTLVVLPTGLGKTVIALMYLLDRLQEGEKVLFLAPTKPLVEQHASYIRKYTVLEDEDVVLFTGEVSPKKRTEVFERAKVIASTPQVIDNDLLARRISLKDVGAIIFDECHRATGNYSYVPVAEKFQDHCALYQRPYRALGLTASPGSDAGHIREVCFSLGLESIEYRTDTSPDVIPYIQHVSIKKVEVDLPEEQKEAMDALSSLYAGYVTDLRGMGYFIGDDLIKKTDMLGLQKLLQAELKTGEANTETFQALSTLATLLKVDHARYLAETQGVESLASYLEKVLESSHKKGASKADKRISMHPLFRKALSVCKKAVGASNPKADRMVEIVASQLEEKLDSKVIVFTSLRDTCNYVVDVLRKAGITAERFVGQAKKGKEKGLSQKEQVSMLQRFREGEFTCLVATSVGEEGLDIPSTEMVIFYESVPSVISSIQRKGRTGRNRAGAVYLLMMKGTRDMSYHYSTRSKERKMTRLIDTARQGLAMERFAEGNAGSTATYGNGGSPFSDVKDQEPAQRTLFSGDNDGSESEGVADGTEEREWSRPKRHGQMNLSDYTE